NKDKLPESDVSALTALVADSRKAIEKQDDAAVTEALEKLEKEAHRIASVMYEKTGPQGGAPPPDAGARRPPKRTEPPPEGGSAEKQQGRDGGSGLLDEAAIPEDPMFPRARRLPDAGAHGRLPFDEVLVAVFRAPRGNTGEDQAEVSCHGSPAVIRRVLDCLEAAGFAPALPGEFSFRAFVNGKTDLVRSEAVAEIVNARSDGARAAALRRIEGGLSDRLANARASLLGLLAEAEVRLDYAEEDGSPSTLFPLAELLAFRKDLSELASSWKAGRIYEEGAKVVLVGRPNAGKSSLFNLLLREERALVSPEPGTTRDWIEVGIEIAGYPLRLIDTAGLRSGSGQLEALGIDKSRSLVSSADIVIYMVDAAAGLVAEDEEVLAGNPAAIRVWNKVDLDSALPPPPGWTPVSAKEGRGLTELLTAIGTALAVAAGQAGVEIDDRESPASAFPCGDVIANERQKNLLERALGSLDLARDMIEASASIESGAQWLDAVTVDLRDAADALGEMTGEISSPEVLERIFSGFCLGK
ncbi:MAG: tRNA uridine-5-carboxymethylaminomethyl(34) synthesis GTPase MnmE, partial [Spirochaetota bacterium]